MPVRRSLSLMKPRPTLVVRGYVTYIVFAKYPQPESNRCLQTENLPSLPLDDEGMLFTVRESGFEPERISPPVFETGAPSYFRHSRKVVA